MVKFHISLVKFSIFWDPFCLRILMCAILESKAMVRCSHKSAWTSDRRNPKKIREICPSWSSLVRSAKHYEDRCTLLGIETFEQRRRTAQVVFVAKIFLGVMYLSEIFSQCNGPFANVIFWCSSVLTHCMVSMIPSVSCRPASMPLALLLHFSGV